jgi:hypothetical protein
MYDHRHEKEGQNEGQGRKAGPRERALDISRDAVIAIGGRGEHMESVSSRTAVIRWNAVEHVEWSWT